MGRAPRCPGWNLKYRASRTSTLAPETRRRDAPRRLDARRRRRHQGEPGNRTWTPLRAREAGTAFTEPHRDRLEFSTGEKVEIPVRRSRGPSPVQWKNLIRPGDINFECIGSA